MQVTDRQVRKMWMERQQNKTIEAASMLAGMTRKTGAKYIESGRLPSEDRKERSWRTREDPFEKVWPEVALRLKDAPELEAKALFEWICEVYPNELQEGQLRSFQRRVKAWRATAGPPKEVFFPQIHPAGKRMSTDFTHMDKLGITILGEEFAHMLCHCVLTRSNWQWATICHSESLLALRCGVQSALLQLGHVPLEHWTDHSTAATHSISRAQPDVRKFNDNYLELMDHFGMEPKTIQVRKPNENGDVEAANGALKRRVKQQLLLRGSSDFDSQESYRRFLEKVITKANHQRIDALMEELAVMKPLQSSLLPEYTQTTARVTSWSTVNIARTVYSVPSRLIGETVKVRQYEERLEIWYGGAQQEMIPRIPGRHHQVNYRHIIDWLIRKPGAFMNYRYRTDLFPDLRLREAYDRLCEKLPQRRADLEYLRILKHAAHNLESEVLKALDELKERNLLPTHDRVLEYVPVQELDIPSMPEFDVQLQEFDQLLGGVLHD